MPVAKARIVNGVNTVVNSDSRPAGACDGVWCRATLTYKFVEGCELGVGGGPRSGEVVCGTVGNAPRLAELPSPSVGSLDLCGV